MRSLVVVLTIVSATFAGTTVYFARELQIEKERTRVAPADLPVKSVVPAHPVSVVVAPPLPQSRLPSPPGDQDVYAPNNQKMIAEQARRTLKTLADPEQRESQQAEYRLTIRNSSPRLVQVVGLSNEEAEQLFTLLAQQQVENDERQSRCIVEPDCNMDELTQPDARDRQIADLLGPERQQRYETYKNTRLEREAVDQLQSRLPDAGRLSFEAGEALIAALSTERQKIHMEAAQRGAGMEGYGSGVGVVFTANDASTPQARFESARANSVRMHERAAEVLNAEQLRVFDDMQDELLISMRNQIRRKEESSAGS